MDKQLTFHRNFFNRPSLIESNAHNVISYFVRKCKIKNFHFVIIITPVLFKLKSI